MHNRRGDGNLISLKSKPFYLKDEDIFWIENTIGTMTLDEKIGQLFVDHNNGDLDEAFIRNRTALTHCGGLRYMNLSPEEILEQNNLYQKHSRIPLLVAANIEAGGNGACKGGTLVGSEIKVAATADLEYAYQLGYIGGRRQKQLAVTWPLPQSWISAVTGIIQLFQHAPGATIHRRFLIAASLSAWTAGCRDSLYSQTFSW